jgi:hypothetical protein
MTTCPIGDNMDLVKYFFKLLLNLQIKVTTPLFWPQIKDQGKGHTYCLSTKPKIYNVYIQKVYYESIYLFMMVS